jgi:hypothetical protein
LPHDVQALGTVMHAVCGDVDQPGAERLSTGGLIQIIQEEIVFAVFIRHASAQGKQLFGHDIQAVDETGNGVHRRDSLCAPPLGLCGHQVAPTFHVPDDVNKCSTERPMADVELTVKLGVGKVARKRKQRSGCPGVVSQESFKNGHLILSVAPAGRLC